MGKENKLKKIWNRKILLLFVLIFSFFASYFTFQTVNYYTSKIRCEFTTSEVVNKTIVEKENLSSIYSHTSENYLYQYSTQEKYNDAKYGEIDISKLCNGHISISRIEEEKYEIIASTRFFDSYFLKSSKSVNFRAKVFLRDVVKMSLKGNVEFKDSTNIVSVSDDKFNSVLISSIICISSTIIATILVAFLKQKTEDDFYGSPELFKTPFHKNYWKLSLKFFDNVKSITTIAMLFALLILSKFIVLPSGFGNLGLSFGYLFLSIICLIYGPVCGLLMGAMSDIVGHFIFDSGTPFFIGYTFQAMLACFIYGLFFYKTKITFFKVLIARLLVSVFCNILIGSLSWGFISNYTPDQTKAYMLLWSLPKNLFYLIPQSILLFIVLRAVLPIISRTGLIDEKVAKRVSLA